MCPVIPKGQWISIGEYLLIVEANCAAWSIWSCVRDFLFMNLSQKWSVA